MRSGVWKFPGALALLISLGLGSVRPSAALADPPHGGRYGGYKWNGMSWNPVPGGAARLVVAPDGTPWVINRQGAIFKRHHDNWRQLPGLARDIGIGADGRVWLVGTNPVPGGFGVYQWNGADWTPIEGGATNIAVGPSGVPMVANAEGRVFALEQAGPPPPPMPPPPMPPPPMPPPPPPPPAPVAYPLAPERFDRMLRQVTEQAFIDAKLQRMQDYLQPETFFTTAQIVRLMQTTPFGGDRVRIAVLLWPRVLDPENFPELVGQLTFESERQELRRKLRR